MGIIRLEFGNMRGVRWSDVQDERLIFQNTPLKNSIARLCLDVKELPTKAEKIKA
jgi:hypothetical protein